MEGKFTQDHQVDLRDYFAVLWARKFSIFLVLALVVGSALLFSYRQTPLYEATARLLVKGVPSDASGFVQPVNLETEAQIVASQPVASLVVADLATEAEVDDLIRGLQVEPASEIAQVLELSYISPDPQMAQAVPNSFAESYIEYKRGQAQEALEVGREAVEEQLAPVQEQLAEITRRLSAPGVEDNEPLLNTLETERSALIARLGVLQQRVDDFETSRPLDLAGGEVIEAASLPESPSSPDHIRNGALAAILGLILGVSLALLREKLDDRIRGRADLERALQVPVLATIPKISVNRKSARELVTLSQPRSVASEAYRSLRTNLQFLMTQQNLRSVLVTSPSAGEGKTVSCANLAVALAQAGQRVILVSADLRRPTLETYYTVDPRPGLSDWLSNDSDAVWDFIKDPAIPNLRVIPSGPIPGNPAELLTSRKLRTLMEILSQNADLVLIDSPPTLAVADASILASHVDGVLLVVNAASTHRSAAVRAKEELERVGASLLGCLFNAYEASGSASYYQPYYYSSSENSDLAASGTGA